MPKPLPQSFDASDPLSRDRTADMLKTLRGLNKEARMLKALIEDAEARMVESGHESPPSSLENTASLASERTQMPEVGPDDDLPKL